LLKIIQFKTWLTIEFDGFRDRELSFVDPVHELSWSFPLVGYFLDFKIEEHSFSVLDSFAEELPVFETLRSSVFLEFPIAIVVPPTLGALCNIDGFHVSIPHLFHVDGKFIDNVFQHMEIHNARDIQILESVDSVFQELSFLTAVLLDVVFMSNDDLF